MQGGVFRSTVLDRIQFLCKQKGLSLSGLEKNLGIGRGTIKKWKTASPQVNTLMAVAQYFGVSMDFLCGLTDQPHPNEKTQECPIYVFEIADESKRAELTEKETEYIKNTIQWVVHLRGAKK